MALMPVIAPFMWGEGGARLTPEQIAQQRKVLEALAGKTDTSPVGHWTQGAARVVDALGGVLKDRRLGQQESQNQTANSDLVARLLGGGASAFPDAPSIPGGNVMTSQGGASSYRDAIASIESGGRYDIVGPTHPKLGRALGKYQVMEANVGPWTQKHLGRAMTPEEFLASPEAQDAVFDGEFGSYVQQYGPEGAAQAWFAGPGGVGKLDRKDVLGTSVGAYSDKFMRQLGGASAIDTMQPAQAETVMAASGGQPAPSLAGIDPQSMLAPPVGVAEDEAGILAQEALTGQQDPMAFAAGGAQPSAQITQALDLSKIPVMAGGTAGARQPGQSQGINPAIIEALSSPYADEQTKRIAGLLLGQQMEQQQAEQERMRAEQEARLQMERRMQAGQAAGIDPRFIGDDEIWKQATQQQFREQPTDIREYEYARGQGYEGTFAEFQQAQKRAGATNITNNVGGESLTPGQKKIDEAFAETYLDWNAGGFADSVKQLDQLDEALRILESGENITGAIGALPAQLAPFFNPNGTVARENVEEVVQRSLREILGAQFTEREGERLIARAFNPLMKPEENAKRVRRLLTTIGSMADAKQDMVDYFDENGTLRGYKGSRPTASQIERLANEFGRSPDEGDSEVPPGIEPSDWQFMTPEERALFQ